MPESTDSEGTRPPKPASNDAAPVGRWIATLSAILGVVGTSLGIYASVRGNELKFQSDVLKIESDHQRQRIEDQKQRIDQQDSQLRVNQDQRAAVTMQREYFLKVVDKVLAAVEKQDEKQQTIALALIDSIEDPLARDRLARVFQRAPTASEDVKQRATEIRKEAQGWDYDVFWCQANAANESTASDIRDALLADPAHGRVRLRPLAAEQNARPGYGANGIEVRAEAQEQEQARHVKEQIARAAQDAVLKTTGQRTPWYISVFVCQ